MWNSQKINSVKNVITKKSTAKAFQVYISVVYDSFILELSISISISTALLLWRERKIQTSSENDNMAVKKISQ